MRCRPVNHSVWHLITNAPGPPRPTHPPPFTKVTNPRGPSTHPHPVDLGKRYERETLPYASDLPSHSFLIYPPDTNGSPTRYQAHARTPGKTDHSSHAPVKSCCNCNPAPTTAYIHQTCIAKQFSPHSKLITMRMSGCHSDCELSATIVSAIVCMCVLSRSYLSRHGVFVACNKCRCVWCGVRSRCH